MARHPSTLPRGLFTDHFLAELRTQNFPVGDMAAPEEPHGWQSDNPNPRTTPFIPFMSLTPGPVQGGTGSVGDSSTEYILRYAVVYAGVSRTQTEDVADDTRRHFESRERLSLTHSHGDITESWRIVHYRCDRIGGVQKISGAFPDYFTQQDEFLVRVSKES